MVEFGNGADPAVPGRAGSRLPPGPDAPSIINEVRRLIAAGRQYASAELAYQADRARLMGKAAGWIAGGGALAAVLLFFVLMALVMGLLLALAPAIGAWWALAVVVGGLLIATAIAGLVAWRALSRFLDLLHDGKDPA